MYEEVFLAKKLIQIHPWAEQVKFARTGGEANAIAIRIARSINPKDKMLEYVDMVVGMIGIWQQI